MAIINSNSSSQPQHSPFTTLSVRNSVKKNKTHNTVSSKPTSSINTHQQTNHGPSSSQIPSSPTKRIKLSHSSAQLQPIKSSNTPPSTNHPTHQNITNTSNKKKPKSRPPPQSQQSSRITKNETSRPPPHATSLIRTTLSTILKITLCYLLLAYFYFCPRDPSQNPFVCSNLAEVHWALEPHLAPHIYRFDQKIRQPLQRELEPVYLRYLHPIWSKSLRPGLSKLSHQLDQAQLSSQIRSSISSLRSHLLHRYRTRLQPLLRGGWEGSNKVLVELRRSPLVRLIRSRLTAFALRVRTRWWPVVLRAYRLWLKPLLVSLNERLIEDDNLIKRAWRATVLWYRSTLMGAWGRLDKVYVRPQLMKIYERLHDYRHRNAGHGTQDDAGGVGEGMPGGGVREERAVVTDEPVVVIKEAEVMIEEPAVVIEEPAVVIEEPAVVFEQPAVVIEEPAVVFEQPAVVIKEPAVEIEKLAVVIEEPADEIEEPAAVIEERVAVIEEPADMIEQPAVVIEESAVVIEEPAVVIEQPAVVVDESALVLEERVDKPEKYESETRVDPVHTDLGGTKASEGSSETLSHVTETVGAELDESSVEDGTTDEIDELMDEIKTEAAAAAAGASKPEEPPKPTSRRTPEETLEDRRELERYRDAGYRKMREMEHTQLQILVQNINQKRDRSNLESHAKKLDPKKLEKVEEEVEKMIKKLKKWFEKNERIESKSEDEKEEEIELVVSKSKEKFWNRVIEPEVKELEEFGREQWSIEERIMNQSWFLIDNYSAEVQATLGPGFTWLDGVTYKDWESYHRLADMSKECKERYERVITGVDLMSKGPKIQHPSFYDDINQFKASLEARYRSFEKALESLRVYYLERLKSQRNREVGEDQSMRNSDREKDRKPIPIRSGETQTEGSSSDQVTQKITFTKDGDVGEDSVEEKVGRDEL